MWYVKMDLNNMTQLDKQTIREFRVYLANIASMDREKAKEILKLLYIENWQDLEMVKKWGLTHRK